MLGMVDVYKFTSDAFYWRMGHGYEEKWFCLLCGMMVGRVYVELMSMREWIAVYVVISLTSDMVGLMPTLKV